LMFRFRDEYHPQVKKDLKKIDKSFQLEIKDFHISKILKDPYIGDELTGDLAGIRSYHFKKDRVQYRISYIIDETKEIVNILMIGKRESFYDILKRRL
jgi:addiction module RelE/StbE family toxin